MGDMMNHQSDYGYSTGAVSMTCIACGSTKRHCCDGRGHKIVTTLVDPPIPSRLFDWSATLDGYEPGEAIGYGETEDAAVADLLGLLEDKRG